MGFNLTHITNDKVKTTVQPIEGFYGELRASNGAKTDLFALKQYYDVKVADARIKGSEHIITTDGNKVASDVVGNAYYSSGGIVGKLDMLGEAEWKLDIRTLHPEAVFVTDLVFINNYLYVATTTQYKVGCYLHKVDSEGKIVWSSDLFEGTSQNRVLNTEYHMGNLYVLNYGRKIHKVNDVDGKITLLITTLDLPTNMILDNEGHIYTSSVSGVNKYDASGGLLWTTSNDRGAPITQMVVKGDTLYIDAEGSAMSLKLSNGDRVKDVPYTMGVARPRFRSESALYLTTKNKLMKIGLESLEVDYIIETNKDIDDLVEIGNTLIVINSDGTIQKLSTSISAKGVSINKESGGDANPPGTENKPLNLGDLKIYEYYNGYSVVAMLQDQYLVKKGNTHYILDGGWDSEPKSVTLPLGTTFKWVNFVEDKYSFGLSRYRLVVAMDEKLFYNMADDSESDINAWEESNVWGLPNTLHPTDPTTKEYNGRIRPKYYIPPTATDVFFYMGGIQHYRIGTDFSRHYNYQDSLWFGTYSQTATPSSVFMTKNGKDVYCEYMYGVNQTVSRIGVDVDVSILTGTKPSDLNLRKVTPIIPDAVNKEPTDVFSFGADIAVSSIALDVEKAKVTATAHGLVTGDIIHFKSDGTAPNKLNWLKPTSYASLINNDVSVAWADATTTPMGNGKIYQVVRIDANSFHLKEAVGNPHNPLWCVHIHSLDVVPNGIVVSTGESGKSSNVTFLAGNYSGGTLRYLPETQQRVFADFAQVHLTSNPVPTIKGSIQRPLGFWFDGDTYLFASDEETYKHEVGLAEGRTGFGFSSTGIYKGKMSEIDSWEKAEIALKQNYVAFLFKKIGDTIITCDVSGEVHYSTDRGDSWKKLYTFPRDIRKFNGASRDSREFVINGYYFVHISQ